MAGERGILFTELLQTCRDRYGSSDASVDLATWICENTTLNKKPFNFRNYPFQRAIAADEHPKLYVEKCSQVGLALALDTPIPTPTGWTTMGEVQVGDTVFDEQGHPTNVTYASPVWLDRKCYDVEFDDGTVIRADADHRWFVKTHRGPFNNSGVYCGKGRPSKDLKFRHEGVVNTVFLADNQSLTTFFVPNTSYLKLPDTELPIDPYVLGLWLGDGHSYSARLTVHENDRPNIEANLQARGYALRAISKIENEIRIGDNSIYNALSSLGLIKNKHVPNQYLRGSVQQRLEILRGLLDTDGSITKRGRISFYNNREALVSAVEELATSLGLKTRTRWRLNAPTALKNGHTITPRKPVAEVSFVSDDCTLFFNLRRKAERQRCDGHRPRYTRNRTIVAVRPAPTVPTRCIQVNSPSHLFLAGRAMVPTHNTEVQIRKFFAMLRRTSGLVGIFTMPNDLMFKRIYNGRMKPILDADAIFNPPMGIKPVRNMDMTQIFDSMGYQTGCKEGDATSISADFLFHDELDLSPMNMIGLFQSRLQNSDLRMTQSFSTPTFLDYGINSGYQLTDQREYMIRCAACNHVQVPEFTQSFIHIPDFHIDIERLTDVTPEQIAEMNLDEIYVKCENCASRLDLNDADRREWVAAYPTRTNTRGYKVRPFSTGRISPGYVFQQLAEYQRKDFVRGFYNTVLGEPYTESSAQIQREEIEKCMAPHGRPPDVGKDRAVFLGLDMGQVCHLSLHTEGENGPEFILFEQIPIFQLPERLRGLRETYSIVQGCADRYPYTPTVDIMRMETGGTIMPVAYGGKSVLVPHRDETGTVDYYTANRTGALDRVRTVITNQQAVLAGYGPYRETLITHLRDMVRDENPEKPEAEPEWKKLNGNDHFFHSMGLSLLARRVCEHVYTFETQSLLSNVVVTSVETPAVRGHLLGNGGANKLSNLGGRR
jgi:hypothetical protein